MKIPVFVSRPTPHLAAQNEFLGHLAAQLASRGFEPITMGAGSNYDYEAPLVGIRRLLTHCSGLISVAFRRTHLAHATKYEGADIPSVEPAEHSDVWLTSPYCQIEPAMAFQLGLPVLILREEGVLAEGVLERGVTGLYSPAFRLNQRKPFDTDDEITHLLDQWGGNVRIVYKRRGDPPNLYE